MWLLEEISDPRSGEEEDEVACAGDGEIVPEEGTKFGLIDFLLLNKRSSEAGVDEALRNRDKNLEKSHQSEMLREEDSRKNDGDNKADDLLTAALQKSP